MVVYSIYIKRLPGFYMTYLYLPCVVIIATSLFAFYLPPGSDSKIDLAVNGLLSQTVFLLLISDLLPPDANDPPYLGMIDTKCFGTFHFMHCHFSPFDQDKTLYNSL